MDIGNKIMELSGGNYGGYAFITDKIKLEDIEIIVNFINEFVKILIL